LAGWIKSRKYLWIFSHNNLWFYFHGLRYNRYNLQAWVNRFFQQFTWQPNRTFFCFNGHYGNSSFDSNGFYSERKYLLLPIINSSLGKMLSYSRNMLLKLFSKSNLLFILEQEIFLLNLLFICWLFNVGILKSLFMNNVNITVSLYSCIND